MVAAPAAAARMVQHKRREAVRIGFAALFALALAAGTAAAQEKWIDYREPAQGFAVQFPGPPKVTRTDVRGKFPLTHFQYEFVTANRVYNISVMAFTKDAPDTSGIAFLSGLIANYAKGTKTALRTQNTAAIAGHPALEAVTEDAANDRYHLVDIFAVAPRVYLIVSEGPKGHETSTEAKRFRNSFKLIP
jgi:hypothetical protein